MRLYEFETKRLLREHGIPVCEGGLARTAAEAEKLAAGIGGPVALKAQVLARGRSEAGGVRFAEAPAQAAREAEEILGLEIGGRRPVAALVEKKAKVAREYCVHVTYDAARRAGVMTATDLGGRDLEEAAEAHPERVKQRRFSTLVPLSDYRAKELVREVGLGGRELVRMTSIVARLTEVFFEYDLTEAEINSLAQLDDGSFIALDAHGDMEEEARYRQRAILDELGIEGGDARAVREPTSFEIEAAKIDAEDPRGIISPVAEFDGDMGLVIGAGGGSLTTFDAIRKHGGRPANYCAIGGNPSVSKAQRLTQLILSRPGVDKIAVISNVVSNTRADLVARGVIKGVVELGFDPAEKITIFRVPGAWESDAFKILEKYGIEYCDRSVSLSEAARRAVAKLQKPGS
jgi:succinyl-CoA synthetase beta subunit/citryl-CoA synthetase large subunit